MSTLLHSQECMRCSYLFLQKREPEGKYFSNVMNLDFDGKKAFFYNESSFAKDSLDVLAFAQDGSVKDENAYAKRRALTGAVTNDKSLIDFTNGIFVQEYFSVARFIGTMPLEIPQWELTGEEDDSSGYHCKVAKAEYLGRTWTIWFTEEIPAGVGPWFLWGAPGLIVYAIDSEKLINFKLMSVTQVGESRADKYLEYKEKNPNRKVFSYSMPEMERMYTKYRTDGNFQGDILGVSTVRITDKNGNPVMPAKLLSYIPLIPDEYWKNK